MAKISIKNLSNAIYESSVGKTEVEIDNLIKNIIKLIHNKKLINKSEEIIKHLEQIINKSNNITKIKILSKDKLDKNIIDEIKDFIKKKYNVKEIEFEFMIDQKLLGGFKIEINNEIIDATLKSKIRKLEDHLINN